MPAPTFQIEVAYQFVQSICNFVLNRLKVEILTFLSVPIGSVRVLMLQSYPSYQ